MHLRRISRMSRAAQYHAFGNTSELWHKSIVVRDREHRMAFTRNRLSGFLHDRFFLTLYSKRLVIIMILGSYSDLSSKHSLLQI